MEGHVLAHSILIQSTSLLLIDVFDSKSLYVVNPLTFMVSRKRVVLAG